MMDVVALCGVGYNSQLSGWAYVGTTNLSPSNSRNTTHSVDNRDFEPGERC